MASAIAVPLVLAAQVSHAQHPAAPDVALDETTSRIVTVTAGEESAEAGVTVLTQAVAIKETGPKKTVARFGEVYAFAPSFIAVHRDEPTALTFWNLQEDDEHDFMLIDEDYDVLMKTKLPPLAKTSFVFTFHREGLFDFYCTMHQPEMSGQVLVLPPRGSGAPPPGAAPR